MKIATRHIRATMFGIIIIFFLLPFIVVSCPGYGRVAVTGFEIASGKTIRGSQLSEFTENKRIYPDPYAYLAILSAVLGIVFSYIKKRNLSFVLCVIASMAGILLLLLLKNHIYIQARRLYRDDLVVRFAIGYWLALWGFIITLITTFILIPSKKFAFPIKKRIVFPFKFKRRIRIRKRR